MKFLLYNNKLQTLEKELKHFYASMAIFYVIMNNMDGSNKTTKALLSFARTIAQRISEILALVKVLGL